MRDILYHLPLCQGLAFRAMSIVTDPMSDAVPVKGYVAQHISRLCAEPGN